MQRQNHENSYLCPTKVCTGVVRFFTFQRNKECSWAPKWGTKTVTMPSPKGVWRARHTGTLVDRELFEVSTDFPVTVWNFTVQSLLAVTRLLLCSSSRCCGPWTCVRRGTWGGRSHYEHPRAWRHPRDHWLDMSRPCSSVCDWLLW